MIREQVAVAVFEDEVNRLQELKTYLPDGVLLVTLATIEECQRFITDVDYAAELLAGAILVACIVDGNIAPTTFDKRDGIQLLTTMRGNPRFAEVLLLSNSGGGILAGAHAHLQKTPWRYQKALPILMELISSWKEQGTADFNLDRL